MAVSPFIATYTSFSGADLVVTFGKNVIGNLQQISYAIQREKVPVFTLGSPNPRSFSRGKRGIAGSLVIAQFDHDALMKTMKDMWDEIAPPNMYTAMGNLAKGKSEDFSTNLNLINWNRVAQQTMSIDAAKAAGIVDTNGAIVAAFANKFDIQGGQVVAIGTYGTGQAQFGSGFSGAGSAVQGLQTNAAGIVTPPGFTTITKDNLQYADQCPPFDVTLTFANEYGQTAFMKIYDLELLNEASGVSVDSVVMEKNYTWIARNISPLYRGIYTRTTDGDIKNFDVNGVEINDGT